MKRKSEKTKEKSSADRKAEKPTRRSSRRHSRRRKKSASSSPERDESGTEENETSVRSSQEDTEEEIPPTSTTAEVGAVITADNSDGEEGRTKKSSKALPNEQTANLENAKDEEWKEDDQFWEEGAPSESADQKHKEKEGKSDIWKVKNPNGGGGQLKLCIIRPQEPIERSPRRRKRLSRSSSGQPKDKKESGDEVESEKKVSGDSSEEKQISSSDEKKENLESCDAIEEKDAESCNLEEAPKQMDKEENSAVDAQSSENKPSREKETVDTQSSENNPSEEKQSVDTQSSENKSEEKQSVDKQSPENNRSEEEQTIDTQSSENNASVGKQSVDTQSSENKSEEKQSVDTQSPENKPSEEKQAIDTQSSENNPSEEKQAIDTQSSENNPSGETQPQLFLEGAEMVVVETVEIPLPEGQPICVQEVIVEDTTEIKDPSEEKKLIDDTPAKQCVESEVLEQNDNVSKSSNRAVVEDKAEGNEETIVSEESAEKPNAEDTSVKDKNDPCNSNKTLESSADGVPDEEVTGVEKANEDSRVEDAQKHVSDEEHVSSEDKRKDSSISSDRRKSRGSEVQKGLDTDSSKVKSIPRKSRESSSSADDGQRSKSKESSSQDHHSDVRSLKKESRDSRRSNRRRESRRKSPENQSSSKHRRKHSRSKSRSPQVRREKVSLRRSFSTKSEKQEVKTETEENDKQKTESVEESVPNQKEDKENRDKKDLEDGSESKPSGAVPRKRRWGHRNSSRPSKKPVLSISTDSLKNLIPGAKPVPIGEVQLTQDEDKREKEAKESDKDDKEKWEREGSVEGESPEKKTTIMLPDAPRLSVAVTDDRGQAVTRKISVVSDDARVLQRTPSPPRHKVSNVLFITNLVRPFTVNQLKELLARTGTIIEGGFWIDKIKSKCYVEYEKESEAKETRHALHGVRWPVSNPKQLCVDFGKKEDMELAQMLAETDQIPRKTEPLKVDRTVEGWVADQAREKELEREQREREKEREQRERERERIRTKDRPHVVPLEALEHSRNAKLAASVREWDLGKIGQVSPNERERDLRYEADRNRERERKLRKEKNRHSRSPSPTEVSVRKSKKKEEDAPAKLLDDLFRKTKTTPCIYWLPLTAEQIVVKEEMRRKHMAEHERRMAEMRKAERERERIRVQQRQRRAGERDKRRRRSGSGSPKK